MIAINFFLTFKESISQWNTFYNTKHWFIVEQYIAFNILLELYLTPTTSRNVVRLLARLPTTPEHYSLLGTLALSWGDRKSPLICIVANTWPCFTLISPEQLHTYMFLVATLPYTTCKYYCRQWEETEMIICTFSIQPPPSIVVLAGHHLVPL